MEGERGGICGRDKREEMQSTDKIEGSSNNLAKLRTAFKWGQKEQEENLRAHQWSSS